MSTMVQGRAYYTEPELGGRSALVWQRIHLDLLYKFFSFYMEHIDMFTRIMIYWLRHEKGKPVAKRGRKATGLFERGGSRVTERR
jgi:hypothetical protein